MKSGEHQAEAQQAATSLQRNLRYALPELVHNVQSSRGSMSTTFKLYDDVSLVCEAVDSLINASEAAGKKTEAAPLTDDYTALAKVRRSLSAYIQQAHGAVGKSRQSALCRACRAAGAAAAISGSASCAAAAAGAAELSAAAATAGRSSARSRQRRWSTIRA